MANGKIFISYRREDTSGESGRLKDKLEQIFGQENIFYDVETLEAGLNFDEAIAKALGESKVLLAMIGPHWLKVTDSKGVLRLQKPEDWVRKEVAEALRRGLRVIPVLVNDAEMPDPEKLPEDLKGLSLKHAQELSSSRWNYDVGELSKVLEKIIDKRPEPKRDPLHQDIPKQPLVPPLPRPESWWAKNYLWVIGGVVAFLFLIGMCAPDEIQTYPEDDSPAYESNIIAGTQDVEETQDQGSGDFIPDMTGEWILYMNGEHVSVFAFGQTGIDVAYNEYNVNNQRTGEGSGQLNGAELVLNYQSTVNNMTGTISLSTRDSGLSWEGTIHFPANAYTAPVVLSRD